MPTRQLLQVPKFELVEFFVIGRIVLNSPMSHLCIGLF